MTHYRRPSHRFKLRRPHEPVPVPRLSWWIWAVMLVLVLVALGATVN